MTKPKSPVLDALRKATISEKAAVEFFEAQRWADAPACPRCGAADVYQMMSATNPAERNGDHRWRCRSCKKMFSVRTGTVYEETRLGMRVWAFAFWRAAASKKGCSALELARETEITHKSALFVLRRIRHGLGTAVDAPKLTGTVEVDETYVGGKPRRAQGSMGYGQRPYWRGAAEKAAVAGIVQRDGDVRFRMLDRVTSDRLSRFVAENADLTCRMITDEHAGYRGVGEAMAGGHETVKHSIGEYARYGTDVHSNTVEGVFSLLKRGIMGTFHSVSRKHLPNYLNEFEFRWNTRKLSDGERVARAIKHVDGKRLEYRESVEQPPYLVPDFKWRVRQAKAPFDPKCPFRPR